MRPTCPKCGCPARVVIIEKARVRCVLEVAEVLERRLPARCVKQRKFFTSGRVGDAAEYIYERMESFYKTLTRHEDKTPHWAKTIQGEGDADAQGG